MTGHKPGVLWQGLALLVCLAFGLHAFCQDKGRDKFIKVFFGNGKSVTAELAVSDEERARGLMFREKILPDQGMLFVFEEEGLHSFWMKNTLIPLDMIWLDSDKRIIHIEADVPPCREDPCPSYGPAVPARYVLELKAGEARTNRLKAGDRLQFVLPESVRKILR
jgi:uncharacterized membrane protein (UPF0127 family)